MQRMTYKLAHDEAEYVAKLAADETFAAFLGATGTSFLEHLHLRLTRNEAEGLRELFTERLARVGFDAAYKPTKEGTLLERLIDRLYMPTG